jgi:hypothetical protein
MPKSFDNLFVAATMALIYIVMTFKQNSLPRNHRPNEISNTTTHGETHRKTAELSSSILGHVRPVGVNQKWLFRDYRWLFFSFTWYHPCFCCYFGRSKRVLSTSLMNWNRSGSQKLCLAVDIHGGEPTVRFVS